MATKKDKKIKTRTFVGTFVMIVGILTFVVVIAMLSIAGLFLYCRNFGVPSFLQSDMVIIKLINKAMKICSTHPFYYYVVLSAFLLANFLCMLNILLTWIKKFGYATQNIAEFSEITVARGWAKFEVDAKFPSLDYLLEPMDFDRTSLTPNSKSE